MDPNTQPATKADLAELKAELKTEIRAELRAEINAQDQRFQGRLDGQEQRILDRMGVLIHESETRLLKVFYGYTYSNEIKMKEADLKSGMVGARVAALEDRVLEIEKRLHMPPSA